MQYWVSSMQRFTVDVSIFAVGLRRGLNQGKFLKLIFKLLQKWSLDVNATIGLVYHKH